MMAWTLLQSILSTRQVYFRQSSNSAATLSWIVLRPPTVLVRLPVLAAFRARSRALERKTIIHGTRSSGRTLCTGHLHSRVARINWSWRVEAALTCVPEQPTVPCWESMPRTADRKFEYDSPTSYPLFGAGDNEQQTNYQQTSELHTLLIFDQQSSNSAVAVSCVE